MNSRLRRLYRAAHAELASMASAEPASDYVTAYTGAASRSPAWTAYTQAMTKAGDRRTRRAERVRWRVAYLLNRLPWVCWADLVSWVMQTHPAVSRSLLECGSRSCREEARTHRDQACYCGKFRHPITTSLTRKDTSA